jgi:hypothetical protein
MFSAELSLFVVAVRFGSSHLPRDAVVSDACGESRALLLIDRLGPVVSRLVVDTVERADSGLGARRCHACGCVGSKVALCRFMRDMTKSSTRFQIGDFYTQHLATPTAGAGSAERLTMLRMKRVQAATGAWGWAQRSVPGNNRKSAGSKPGADVRSLR